MTVKRSRFQKADDQEKLREAINDGTTLDLGTYYPSGEARADLFEDHERVKQTAAGQRQGRQKGTDTMRQKGKEDAAWIVVQGKELRAKGVNQRDLVSRIEAIAECVGKKMKADKIRTALKNAKLLT